MKTSSQLREGFISIGYRIIHQTDCTRIQGAICRHNLHRLTLISGRSSVPVREFDALPNGR
jgi:hypothetical protein